MVNSRRKGIVYELNTRNWLRRWWPKCERSFGQSRRGSDAPDVSGTPYWIECKHYSRKITEGMIIKWLEKAKTETKEPIIVRYKQDYKENKYAMWRSDLINLEREACYDERPNIRNWLGYASEIPEQYMSDLLDFAYGVSDDYKMR